jgi:transcriptional regulator of acetoin/glycerol metabolism
MPTNLDASRGSEGNVHYPTIEQLGNDPQMTNAITRGKRLIDRSIPILILGETGTGKEFLSRALHAYSARRARHCVAVNCASIPESLAESELFGYCRGAFSGALAGGMKGKIQQADGGTLFLDEIGDMPLALQTRLLRVLSERELTPLGASHPTHVDLHLISATHQDLRELITAGRFREDLYYRIAGGVLRLPALRERTDRRELIMQMLADELPGRRVPEQSISPQALDRLLDYSWPGNLRQMYAVIRFACAVMNGSMIEVGDLPEDLISQTPKDVAPIATTAVVAGSGQVESRPSNTGGAPAGPASCDERARVLAALNGSRWNISAASRKLGMCRASLYRKLRHFDISPLRAQSKAWPIILADTPVRFSPEYVATNQPVFAN